MVKKNAKETVGQHAALKFTKVNAILGVAGLACMVLGYALLAQGSITAAPLLLVFAYVVLIPMAIIK
ncbi:MAG: hypothetical protein O2992_02685 [Gemmatimonadetes bacterium]|jgi:hypothetical protein|nr:hypothetical protein [Gemmatimonadota bacterium]